MRFLVLYIETENYRENRLSVFILEGCEKLKSKLEDWDHMDVPRTSTEGKEIDQFFQERMSLAYSGWNNAGTIPAGHFDGIYRIETSNY